MCHNINRCLQMLNELTEFHLHEHDFCLQSPKISIDLFSFFIHPVSRLHCTSFVKNTPLLSPLSGTLSTRVVAISLSTLIRPFFFISITPRFYTSKRNAGFQKFNLSSRRYRRYDPSFYQFRSVVDLLQRRVSWWSRSTERTLR